jgi:hypothetical protein
VLAWGPTSKRKNPNLIQARWLTPNPIHSVVDGKLVKFRGAITITPLRRREWNVAVDRIELGESPDFGPAYRDHGCACDLLLADGSVAAGDDSGASGRLGMDIPPIRNHYEDLQ